VTHPTPTEDWPFIRVSNKTKPGKKIVCNAKSASKLPATKNISASPSQGTSMMYPKSDCLLLILPYLANQWSRKFDASKRSTMKILLKIALLVAFIVSSINIFSQNLDWVHGIGGSTIDLAYQIVQDDTGNVYAVGNFSDTVDFDPGPGVFNLIGNGFLNIFVSKYNAAGNLIWAINIGGIGNDQAWDVVLDSLGNIYVTGFFQEIVDFDPGPGVFNLGGPANSDEPYVMKLSNSGNLLWAISFSGSSGICYQLELDAAGDILALGSFVLNINFGIATFNSVGGTIDIFLAKISPTGNPIWVKQFGGHGIDRAYGLATDAFSNSYFGGSFRSTLDFDPNLAVHNVTPIGSSDAFLCKMDNNGNLDWVKNFGAVGAWSEVNSVAKTTIGNPYISGYFIDSIDFDPGIGTQMLQSAGSLEAFVAKYDMNGDFVWANAFGGDSVDIVEKIALDDQGNLFTIGTFSRLADLDPGAGMMNFTSHGLYDVFLQKWTPTGTLYQRFNSGEEEMTGVLGFFAKVETCMPAVVFPIRSILILDQRYSIWSKPEGGMHGYRSFPCARRPIPHLLQ
jgi:hypothetical protein